MAARVNTGRSCSMIRQSKEVNNTVKEAEVHTSLSIEFCALRQQMVLYILEYKELRSRCVWRKFPVKIHLFAYIRVRSL